MVGSPRPESGTSWLRENSTLIYFLLAQLIAFSTAGASILAYMVKLETRVSIMETRGAEYTVARMDEMKQRITVIEEKIDKNSAQIDRLIDQYLKKPQ